MSAVSLAVSQVSPPSALWAGANLPYVSPPSALWAGANLPWKDFGYDFGTGSFDRGWFDGAIANLSASGANAVRVWVHADGRASPSFAADGSVRAAGGPSLATDLQELATLAKAHRVVLQLCLWSFDMCRQDVAGAAMHADLISNTSKTASYVEAALLPMLAALGNGSSGTDHVAIEIINEPEWCMDGPCNTKECVSVSQMQRFTSVLAEAVHTHSNMAVTTGSASLKWSTTLPGGGQAMYWSDAALRKAYPEGGTDGTLDFYNVHYYDWMFDPSWGYDPCRVPASHWGLDKPTVVAELPATSTHYTPSALLNCSLANGFAGDLFWAMNDPSFPIDAALPALASFSARHKEATSFEALLKWLSALRPSLRARRAPAGFQAVRPAGGTRISLAAHGGGGSRGEGEPPPPLASVAHRVPDPDARSRHNVSEPPLPGSRKSLSRAAFLSHF